MNFTQRKLPREAAEKLRNCPIGTVSPYALMLAPVYVFMKMNEKFVSIKAPLDFFTPEELDRFRSFETFFLPEFVDAALPFCETARKVRALLSWDPSAKNSAAGKYPEIPLPPAPYELSDAVLRMVGPLWSRETAIEPFFVSVFVNEICDLLPPAILHHARDTSVVHFEKAIFQSSWAVFLALHLGYCELGFLNRLRVRVFEAVSKQTSVQKLHHEVDELMEMVEKSLQGNQSRALSGEFFLGRPERVAQKIAGRLNRILDQKMSESVEPSSIYGPEGFIDV